ncbi:TPA: DUF5993 family protein [Klebsiella aerogenes]|nr:DUF5993 family protein [Klebsiella aerogenes]MDT8883998.1 DUF5993 family protein [Klebsiella aerogenes]
MFLPFLMALIVMVGVIFNKARLSYICYFLLFVVAILSFVHHVSDPLNLLF